MYALWKLVALPIARIVMAILRDIISGTTAVGYDKADRVNYKRQVDVGDQIYQIILFSSLFGKGEK